MKGCGVPGLPGSQWAGRSASTRRHDAHARCPQNRVGVDRVCRSQRVLELGEVLAPTRLPLIVGLMKPSRSEPIADVVVRAGDLADRCRCARRSSRRCGRCPRRRRSPSCELVAGEDQADHAVAARDLRSIGRGARACRPARRSGSRSATRSPGSRVGSAPRLLVKRGRAGRRSRSARPARMWLTSTSTRCSYIARTAASPSAAQAPRRAAGRRCGCTGVGEHRQRRQRWSRCGGRRDARASRSPTPRRASSATLRGDRRPACGRGGSRPRRSGRTPCAPVDWAASRSAADLTTEMPRARWVDSARARPRRGRGARSGRRSSPPRELTAAARRGRLSANGSNSTENTKRV